MNCKHHKKAGASSSGSQKRNGHAEHVDERPTIVLRSRESNELKKKHQAEIEGLYSQKVHEKERRSVQQKINAKVVSWNESHPLERNYFDLHGMSTGGAVCYARAIVESADGCTVLKFETGRGNHSKNGVPVIKLAVWKELGSMEKCSVREQKYNSGVLIVTIR